MPGARSIRGWNPRQPETIHNTGGQDGMGWEQAFDEQGTRIVGGVLGEHNVDSFSLCIGERTIKQQLTHDGVERLPGVGSSLEVKLQSAREVFQTLVEQSDG